MPSLKYFINKSVVLRQYREACKLAYEFEDPATRRDILAMMQSEFKPFMKYSRAYEASDAVQTDVDYLLAKTRQRMN